MVMVGCPVKRSLVEQVQQGQVVHVCKGYQMIYQMLPFSLKETSRIYSQVLKQRCHCYDNIHSKDKRY